MQVEVSRLGVVRTVKNSSPQTFVDASERRFLDLSGLAFDDDKISRQKKR
jgi:hypothetical protein